MIEELLREPVLGKKRLVTELVTVLVIDGKKGEPEGRIKDIRKPAIPCGLRVSLVEVTGFEPATFWSRTKRATKLRYTSIEKSWSQ